MTSLMKAFGFITTLVLLSSCVSALILPGTRHIFRQKRQFEENIDPSLGQTIQGIQNQQQQAQPWPQPGSGGFQQGPGGFQQGSGGFQQGSGGFQQGSGGFQQGSGGFQQGGVPTRRPISWTTQRSPANQIIVADNQVDQYSTCYSGCRTTNEWNPVCGTDNNSYPNMGRLRCAQQCGRQTAFLYNGNCVTTPAPAVTPAAS